MPQKILIVGFGDIGERLARRLFTQKHRLYALVHTPERAVIARQMGISAILGDLSNRASLRRLAGLADIVYHFAPPSIASLQDQHTRNLLAALASPNLKNAQAMLPQRIIYISTTGVYGDCQGQWVDETRALQPQTERAKRRQDAEHTLKAWGQRNQVCVTLLRAPGIYADNRLPIARLQQQTPALNAEDDVYTNHIHADDLARAAHHAARWGLPNRSYNIVDNSDLKMGEYLDLVATHLNLPKPPRISRSAATHQLPAQNLSFMQESRRISNLRIKQEWGFRFRHPTVSAFLQETMPIDTHEGNH